MKDGVSSVPPEEVKALIKSCLEKAALVNYTKLSAEAKIEDDFSGEVCASPSKKLEDLIHLAEMCVDLLQQNGEHYSKVLVGFLQLNVIFSGSSRSKIIDEKEKANSIGNHDHIHLHTNRVHAHTTSSLKQQREFFLFACCCCTFQKFQQTLSRSLLFFHEFLETFELFRIGR